MMPYPSLLSFLRYFLAHKELRNTNVENITMARFFTFCPEKVSTFQKMDGLIRSWFYKNRLGNGKGKENYFESRMDD